MPHKNRYYIILTIILMKIPSTLSNAKGKTLKNHRKEHIDECKHDSDGGQNQAKGDSVGDGGAVFQVRDLAGIRLHVGRHALFQAVHAVEEIAHML